MLVCAHPAIAENCRTPLMLQTVLGIDRRGYRRGVRAARRDHGPAAGPCENAGSAMLTSRSWCRRARSSTSGCPPCWRPSTVPWDRLGDRLAAAAGGRRDRVTVRPRRCIWR